MGVTVSKFQEHRPCMGDMALNLSTDLDFDYDLIIIGGGSGGLAAAKAAAKLGKRVAICDFVKPSPAGTSWGLGGTCVNVGCIPKKLMHQAALLGQAINDASYFGWEVKFKDLDHNWSKMVIGIQNYIHSLNWGYKVTLQNDEVHYYNAFATFVDNHSLCLSDEKKEEPWTITAEHFIIAVGGRPRYLDIPGGRPGEYCITSDDIFSLPHHPGRVLLIGGSYVALECAGFLAGMGIDTTVMVRSVLLRGFDQQMAKLVGKVLEDHDVQLINGYVPLNIEKIGGESEDEESLPQLLVTSENVVTKEISEDVYNTIILAVGRDPVTQDLMLEKAGVTTNAETGKILTNEAEQTSIGNIFAIGDVAEHRPELTPVAIQSGVRLVKRLYGGSQELIDYLNIATTVFTPLEYGSVGYAEEDALAAFGEENIEVYHLVKQPLEFALPSRDTTTCYSKLICLKSENEKVIGFHYLGPCAGEITQGFALAMRLNATKADFDSTIGIHPTSAELFTTLSITKSSGKEWLKTSC